ncbi:CoA-binding protein [Paeniglutamicibacter psychrophenolicus]|uniref:CoA-binding protein n=1 Tax=Paeniglutamicibacter psychrophenolicus TaxID=257454 RepID=A0ABS4W7Y5_9MICC|nr:CoA-binding protein [Paeniglutamicibacter psychrophenolicus]MBP2372322.1 putative CoA-binding protein [Paeniglutamicibacter psychrophenolicus]
MSNEVGQRHVNDPAVVRRLLQTPARWAVVGLTNNPRRVAPGVSYFLQEQLGMEVIPVSLSGEEVLGNTGYKRLADIPGHIAVVDCFVNSQKVGDIVDQAIAVGADALWLQLGVIDESAAARAKAAGLEVVMDTCPKIEYPFL